MHTCLSLNWTCILNIYTIDGPFGDIMLNHDLWLDVGCNYIYAIKIILIVNVKYNYFKVLNWNHKLTFFLMIQINENVLWLFKIFNFHVPIKILTFKKNHLYHYVIKFFNLLLFNKTFFSF